MAPAERSWWRSAACWLLAAVLLATGIGKALDVAGFAAVLAAYRLLPAPLLLPAAIGLTLAELAIAAGLCRHATRRPAAMAALALSLLNAVVLTVTLARGIALANCGCFGVFLARPLRPWTPVEDLVLAALAALVLTGRAAGRRAPC